jgi:HK97 family phage major capsid protein
MEPESDQLIYFGGEVKSLGGGKIGGYLVRFTGPDDTDLEGDYFTSDTVFGKAADLDLYWNHGLDIKIGRESIGEGSLKKDEWGLWMEGVLDERKEYEKYIEKLIGEGKVGFSSGAVGHLVERERTGKSFWIKRWPIGEASLTHTPAEPRNSAVPIKSLLQAEADVAETASETGRPPVDDVVDEMPEPVSNESVNVIKTTNEMEEINLDEQTVNLTADINKLREEVKALGRTVNVTLPVAAPTFVRSSTRPDTLDNAVKAWFRSGATTDVSDLLDGDSLVLNPLSAKSWKASNATDMNIGTAADGGDLVPVGHYNQIIARRDEKMLANKLGCMLVPGKGTTVNVPYDNEADGELITKGEATEYDLDAPAVAKHAMTLVKYTKRMLISDELMQDEDSNLMPFIAEWVGRGMAKTHNELLVTAITASSTQAKRFAGMSAVAAGEIDGMPYTGDLPYYLDDGGSIAWLMAPATFGAITALTGNFRLYADQSQGNIQGQSLFGYPVHFSNKVAIPGTKFNKSVWFGNWRYVAFRNGPEIGFIRDPYTLAASGQLRLLYYFRTVYKTIHAEAIVYGDHSKT